jgi:hypothetical protein
MTPTNSFHIFIILFLSYIFGFPFILSVMTLYNMTFKPDRNNILAFICSINWFFFGFWKFIYMTCCSAVILFVLHIDKVMQYYNAFKNLLKIALKLHEISPDPNNNDINDVIYIDKKINLIENNLSVFTNIPVFIKKISEEKWNKYKDQEWFKLLIALYYAGQYLSNIVANQIIINSKFFWQEIKQYKFVDTLLTKFNNYTKIYKMANDTDISNNSVLMQPPDLMSQMPAFNMAEMMGNFNSMLEGLSNMKAPVDKAKKKKNKKKKTKKINKDV